jgi:ribosome-binding factor A
LFDRELSDPRLANVNVTRVEMSPDLRYARVYVAPQPTPDESTQMMQGLEHAVGFIRHRLAQALNLRLAPEIRFELDRAIEKVERFLQVLAQVEAEERAYEHHSNL